MAFYPEKYIPKTGERDQTKLANQCGHTLHAQLAKVIAEHLAALFRLGINSGEYLFEGENWMDPGPIIDLSPAFVEWDGTPLRPHNLNNDLPADITLLDITSGLWKPKTLIGLSRRRGQRH